MSRLATALLVVVALVSAAVAGGLGALWFALRNNVPH